MAHELHKPRGTLEERELIELDLLLEGIYRCYGLDFRGYARGSVLRRVWSVVKSEGLETLSALQAKVLHDPSCMERLLKAISVNVTTMFRDPTFFRAFREEVVPHLRSVPFVRIWHAGCSTGEEVYSLAIVLMEEGLYDRSRIYATDMNPEVLERAKEGIYSLQYMQEFSENYFLGGGKRSLSDYYMADYESVVFRKSLRRNVVYGQHNLVSDGSFNEFNVILCRNVLIYFDDPLQERVHQLFFDSLRRFGVLALGSKETIRHTSFETKYEPLVEPERIYRKCAEV